MAQRKKNKQSEETLVDIIEVKDQAQGFIEKNRLLVFGGLVGLVLIIGGLFAYNNFYKKPRQQDAVTQMAQAQVQFERDSFALALTNPGPGHLGFLDIIDSYGGTPAANLALYYAGVSYLNLGEYDAAVSYLKDFNPKGEIMPIMKFGALGDAVSESGDLPGAMTYYKKAVNAKDNEVLTPYYLKKIGMLHEKNGDTDAAFAAYEEIKKDFPNSTEASDIDKYLTRVATK